MAGESYCVVINLPSFRTGEGPIENINLQMTAGEESILVMLRAGYGNFEKMIKASVEKGTRSSLPSGLVDDALVLLRCMVFNKLQAHTGKFVHITRA
jgi:hypothetical protein